MGSNRIELTKPHSKPKSKPQTKAYTQSGGKPSRAEPRWTKLVKSIRSVWSYPIFWSIQLGPIRFNSIIFNPS
ncbi:hypothetical protein HZH66_000548 [Vespula vulgaris]|uniref:Uncharacterized protein n=1 Tax=Vespula vulgaris TaxID=7454 RepID=A0A834KRQ0_VESVU|nr:hypothetical protein HZH66_000548 [Vespula vulgaris]